MDKIETTEITMCYRCNGRGKEVATQESIISKDVRDCPVCKGNGLLKRIITYEPYNPKDNG